MKHAEVGGPNTEPRAVARRVMGLRTSDNPAAAGTNEAGTDAGEFTESAPDPEDSTDKLVTTAAANILVLPLPTSIVPFPLTTPEATSTSAAPAATGPDAVKLPVSTGSANSTVSWGTILEIPPAIAGDPRAATAADSIEASSPGIDLRRLGLESLSERERLAIDLRQAMAHLEDSELEAPETDATDTATEPKIVPFPGPASAHDNKIVRVQFRPSDPSFGLVPPEHASDANGAGGGGGADPQLPTGAGPEENSAGLAGGPSRPMGSPEQPGRGAGPARQTGFAWRTETVTPPHEADGTSTARKERNMDSLLSSAELGPIAGRSEHAEVDEGLLAPAPRPLEGSSRLGAGEWLAAGQTRSATHAAGEVSPDAMRPADAANSVERIAKMVSREAVLFRQHSSESMAVVLRPDANTELLLHLSLRHGQLEASVRCERGDFQQLNALWGQLQESMSQQKVRLAPLQEAASDPGSFRPSGGSLPQQGRDESARQSRPDSDFMEEWPAPASSHQTSAHVRSRGEDPGRRHSTSRPGWETWA